MLEWFPLCYLKRILALSIHTYNFNRLWIISAWNISARVISAQMFHHGNISARAPFGGADIPADGHFNKGKFWHGDFSEQELFGTRNFRHGNISTRGNFRTWTFRHCSTGAEMSILLCKVPKYPNAEMFRCRNIPVLKCSGAKNSSCRKFPVLKIPHVETFQWWKVHLPKCLQRWTVHVPKCSRDETSMPKWLLPKGSVPKWSISNQ